MLNEKLHDSPCFLLQRWPTLRRQRLVSRSRGHLALSIDQLICPERRYTGFCQLILSIEGKMSYLSTFAAGSGFAEADFVGL